MTGDGDTMLLASGPTPGCGGCTIFFEAVRSNYFISHFRSAKENDYDNHIYFILFHEP